jgi:hypothetical protein
MSVLEKLTEGIVERSLAKEGAALMEKWERTGLLEGLNTDAKKNGMARLLENQASQLLKEASTMAGGNAEGFASVAFPIVRRVFGGLLANELVSVQPMSLPSGLIFFLDFTFSSNTAHHQFPSGRSLYGGGRVGQQITGGVSLDSYGSGSTAFDTGESSFYNLNNGYASPTGSVTVANANINLIASGNVLAENSTAIPEIDIKVDSVSVTAVTKKLKAKWTPELGQDLNAYHNLDAEVELTQILSEQIALEIDREILNDLVQGATAGTYYWSRSPGLFVNKHVTGTEIGASFGCSGLHRYG